MCESGFGFKSGLRAFWADSDLDSGSELVTQNLDSDSRKKGGFESRFKISGSNHTPTNFHNSPCCHPRPSITNWIQNQILIPTNWIPIRTQENKWWIHIQLDSDPSYLDSDSDLRRLDSHITGLGRGFGVK